MHRRALFFPVWILLVTGLLAGAIALTAAGTAITNPVLGCAPSAGTALPRAGRVVSGAGLDAGQVANAWIIYSVGARLGLPQQAEIVAVATAMAESALQDLPYDTSDSVGLFQQRPSLGWAPSPRSWIPSMPPRRSTSGWCG